MPTKSTIMSLVWVLLQSAAMPHWICLFCVVGLDCPLLDEKVASVRFTITPPSPMLGLFVRRSMVHSVMRRLYIDQLSVEFKLMYQEPLIHDSHPASFCHAASCAALAPAQDATPSKGGDQSDLTSQKSSGLTLTAGPLVALPSCLAWSSAPDRATSPRARSSSSGRRRGTSRRAAGAMAPRCP